MQNIKVPAWLISIAGIIFILVVLERLYVTKVPVDIWGLKLNQPTVQGPSAANYKLEWREVSASYLKTETRVLGEESAYLFWALAGQNVYRHGQNNGGTLACEIYIENDAWVLKAIGGDQTIDKNAGVVKASCKAVGLKIAAQ